MELGKTRTSRTGLALLALIVAAAALGLALLASGPKVPEIPVSVPKVQQATEQEIEEAWKNLADAILRQDQEEAMHLAKWLDKQRGLEAHITEVVRDWCAHSSQKWDFCKEKDNAEK